MYRSTYFFKLAAECIFRVGKPPPRHPRTIRSFIRPLRASSTPPQTIPTILRQKKGKTRVCARARRGRYTSIARPCRDINYYPAFAATSGKLGTSISGRGALRVVSIDGRHENAAKDETSVVLGDVNSARGWSKQRGVVLPPFCVVCTHGQDWI